MSFPTFLGVVTSIIAIVGAVIGVVKWQDRNNQLKQDEERVVALLKQSLEDGNTFRTTHAMASNLDIGEERVRKACQRSKLIRRNELELESWRLA